MQEPRPLVSHTGASGFCSNAGPRLGPLLLGCTEPADALSPQTRARSNAPPNPRGADRGGVIEQAGFFFLQRETYVEPRLSITPSTLRLRKGSARWSRPGGLGGLSDSRGKRETWKLPQSYPLQTA